MGHLPVPRPFLKWAGGKTQLADALLERKPVRFNTYHEPFLGSGAIFFRLYRENQVRDAVLSDMNAELIDTYLAIRDHVAEVIDLLSGFPHSKEFYYEIRRTDPQKLSLPERAARMIYLNKTGYNGLYRVNQKGQFNVPFGRYQSPKYLDRENLLAVSQALQNVEILCTPFDTIVDRAKPGDWVYFDPPYVPISETANFTAYYPNGFGLRDQERLRDICIALSQNNVHIMVSNSDTAVVRSLYASPYFTIDEVLANRAINCKGARRIKVTELVITNYPLYRATQLQFLDQEYRSYLPNTDAATAPVSAACGLATGRPRQKRTPPQTRGEGKTDLA
ncbi:MAG: DNA adenine methylase [Anaerolineales bacterium]|nr:DNA adenine methylase [Anaerolineales bacterium]MDW8162005.1 DNA adenine methylase [Anaerolineales bacterium]